MLTIIPQYLDKFPSGYGYPIGGRSGVDMLIFCMHIHAEFPNNVDEVTSDWNVVIHLEEAITDKPMIPLYSFALMSRSGYVPADNGFNLPMKLLLNTSGDIEVIGIQAHGHALGHRIASTMIALFSHDKVTSIANIKFERIIDSFQRTPNLHLHINSGDTLSVTCSFERVLEHR